MYKRIFVSTLLLMFFLTLPASLLWANSHRDKGPNLPKYLIHYVSKGENLHDISGYYLSNPRRWPEIYELNKENIDNPDRLTVGIGIVIPVSALPPSSPSFKEYLKNIGTSLETRKGVAAH